MILAPLAAWGMTYLLKIYDRRILVVLAQARVGKEDPTTALLKGRHCLV
jgi:hypothetical protein